MKVNSFNKSVKKTKQDRTVSQRLKKKDFVQMLAETEKYPFLIRIAAELFRSGVSGRRFLESYHLEGNGASDRVHEYLVNFDLKKGIDPIRVPSLLPQFVRWIPPQKVKEIKEREKRGRPTNEEAKVYLQKIIKECLSRGWDEVDFINNFRELMDVKTINAHKIKVEEDDEDKETKKIERSYFVRLGTKWIRFSSKGDADKATQEDDEKILGPVDVPDISVHCSYCRFRLNGTVVVVRNDKSVDYMHLGCYFMEVSHPSTVPIGMTVLNAPSGIYYKYLGPEKGGWQKQVEVKNEEADTTGEDGSGVSEPPKPANDAPKVVSPKA